MQTRIQLEIDERKWVVFFAKKVKSLNNHSYNEEHSYVCIKLKDGMVYGYDGVFVLTNSDNKSYQIIIVTPEHLGITLIDTKEVSKNKKQLINQIEIFLKQLHAVIVDTTSKGEVPVRNFPEHTLDDIMEQIIKDNSL